MDGVIIDSHPVHRKAWFEFLQTLGKEPTQAELDFILEGRKRSEILQHFLGSTSGATLANLGGKKDDLFQKMSDDVLPIPGVARFLEQTQQAELSAAVATSASKQRTTRTLEKLGLRRFFQTVVTGDDVVLGKPSPEVYALAAKRLRIAPEDLLAVEDAPAGVEAAISSGMRCIGLGVGLKAKALMVAGAEYIIQDFTKISVSTLAEILYPKDSSSIAMIRARSQ